MSPTEKCMILLQIWISNPNLKQFVSYVLVCALTSKTRRKRYVCCMYCCSSSHANGLVRNQLKVHVLQKDGERNNSFQQSELITNTLTRPSTEWNEPVVYIFALLVKAKSTCFSKWDQEIGIALNFTLWRDIKTTIPEICICFIRYWAFQVESFRQKLFCSLPNLVKSHWNCQKCGKVSESYISDLSKRASN